jgi:hypothetical protein
MRLSLSTVALSNEKIELRSFGNDPILFFTKDEKGEVRIQIHNEDKYIVETWIPNDQLKEVIKFLQKQIIE